MSREEYNSLNTANNGVDTAALFETTLQHVSFLLYNAGTMPLLAVLIILYIIKTVRTPP